MFNKLRTREGRDNREICSEKLFKKEIGNLLYMSYTEKEAETDLTPCPS
jgi:hypothetical protein